MSESLPAAERPHGPPIDGATRPASGSGAGQACLHFRSKGMYVTGCLDPARDDGAMGDGHCWCNLTQHALGPDDQFAARAKCQSGRSCYVALVQ